MLLKNPFLFFLAALVLLSSVRVALAVPKAKTAQDFPIWKTVQLGGDKLVASEIEGKLEDLNCSVLTGADKMLLEPAFILSKTLVKLNLVIITPDQFGLNEDHTTRTEVCAAALRHGLQLCPAEVAPRLLLQDPTCVDGRWLLIGMEPIMCPEYFEKVRVFGIGDRCLCTYATTDNNYRSSGWVFVKPNK